MVTTYCQLYNLPVSVMHLHNVYGQWSDPDGIVHFLTEQIYNDLAVKLPFKRLI